VLKSLKFQKKKSSQTFFPNSEASKKLAREIYIYTHANASADAETERSATVLSRARIISSLSFFIVRSFLTTARARREEEVLFFFFRNEK